MDLVNINDARSLAVLLRDEMDMYAGREFPEEFCQRVQQMLNIPRYRKMMYKGAAFSGTFKAVLREYRLTWLQKIIDGE